MNAIFMGMTISSQAASRKCSKCQQQKPLTEFYFRKSKGYHETRCKPCVAVGNRHYYEANRQKLIDSAEAYRKSNPEWAKTYYGAYTPERQRNFKRLAFERYGLKCSCCGESNLKFLTLDHVDNDGGTHRREIKQANFYWWLWRNNYPSEPKLQTLCYNCNFGRNHNGGICPHAEGSETIRKE